MTNENDIDKDCMPPDIHDGVEVITAILGAVERTLAVPAKSFYQVARADLRLIDIMELDSDVAKVFKAFSRKLGAIRSKDR